MDQGDFSSRKKKYVHIMDSESDKKKLLPCGKSRYIWNIYRTRHKKVKCRLTLVIIKTTYEHPPTEK